MRKLLCLLSVIILCQTGLAKNKKPDIRARSVASLEEDLKTLEAQNKAGDDELAQVKKDIAEHTAEKIALQEQIDKAIKNRDSLKRTYNDMSAVKSTQAKELQDKMQEFKKHQAQNNAEGNKFEKDADHMKAGIKKLEDLADSKEIELKKSKEHLQSSKDRFAEIKKQKEKLQQAITASVEARNKLLKDTADTQKEMAVTQTDIAGLKNKFVIAQKNQNAATEQYKMTAAQLANANAINKAEHGKLQSKEESIADLNRLIKAGKEELERAKKEHDNIVQRNQKAAVDKPRLEMQAAQLKEQYRQITSQTLALQKGR